MIDVLIKAAEEGGKVALSYFGKQLVISRKTNNQDTLTDADLGSQKKIIEEITTQMERKGIKKSEVGFLAEEGVYKKGKYLFVIDPIDGTTNFSSGIDTFYVSIALMVNKKVIAACVHQPATGSFFIAEENKGAYKIVNGEKIKLEIRSTSLADCLVGTYLSSSEELMKRQLKIIKNIFPSVEGVRFLGGVCLDFTFLAENKLNISFQARPRIWDIAAAKLIIEEAGGVVVNWQGEKIEFESSEFSKGYQSLACHPKVLTHVLKYFKS